MWALGFWNLKVKNLKDFFPAQKPQSFFENLKDFFETHYIFLGKNYESRYEFEFWKEVFAKFKLQKERRIWDNALIEYEFGDDFTGNDVVDEVEVTQIRL